MPKQLLNYLVAFFNLRQAKPQILLIVELVKFIELESLPPHQMNVCSRKRYYVSVLLGFSFHGQTLRLRCCFPIVDRR